MESVEICITAPVRPQPSLPDRLLFSSWYLEARVVLKESAAHYKALAQRLEELVKAGAR